MCACVHGDSDGDGIYDGGVMEVTLDKQKYNVHK